jgi:hypothetical protein
MKRILAPLVLAGLAVAALSTGAQAAGNANAKIMLMRLAPTTKTQCTRTQLRPADCTGYDGVSNLALYPTLHFAYVLVVDGSLAEGIAGVQFGIDYQTSNAGSASDGVGLDIYGWTLCATLEFQAPAGGAVNSWPNANSGNLVTWDAILACQQTGNANIGAVGVVGYFYCGAYGDDVLRIERRQVDDAAKVANCASAEDVTFDSPNPAETFLGALGFGNGVGINPCGRELPVPVESTTWSGVKTLLK